MSKYSELAEWLDACRSGSVPDAKAHEAAFAIRRLEARVAELRGLLKELRIRLHVTGRRPEECYEMSLIDAALLYCEARSDIRERHMSSKEAEAAWDSAEYNAKRAESAEARVAELKAENERLRRNQKTRIAREPDNDDLRLRGQERE